MSMEYYAGDGDESLQRAGLISWDKDNWSNGLGVSMKTDIKKIFVTKQGGIGDVILTTPVLKKLKELYPQTYITLLIFDNAKDLVDGLSFIDEIFCYNKKRDGFLKLWRKMLGYDAAIFLDLTYRPAMVAALAGIPVRVGLEHKRKFWLTKRIKWKESMDYTYEPYVLADIVNEALDIAIVHEDLHKPFVVSAGGAELADLHGLLQEKGLTDDDKYITSSPTTAFFLKDWPLERWNELYKRIYRKYGLKTVIFGAGNLDFEWDGDAVINLWGLLNLRQVGAIIKNAALLVSSCSLPIHIAAATDTFSVVIYGYTAPERWAPREKCETVVTSLPCSPCDGYHGSTCTEPKCMQQMTVEEVYAACERQLEKYLHES